MGINDEYSRDAYLGDHYLYDSDDDDDFDSQVDPEDWQAIYSDELLNGWMTIRAWFDEQYLEPRATYNMFVEFVLEPTPYWTSCTPTCECTMLWNEISKIDVIRDRVDPQEFTGWYFSYLTV